MTRRLLLALFLPLLAVAARVEGGPGELAFQIYGEPKTLNPLAVADDASHVVAYLTTGVLVRLNRITQQLEPELAESWQVLDDGRRIRFTLRRNIQFSDGSAFTPADVRYTIGKLVDPATGSPLAQSFTKDKSTATVKTTATTAEVIFPAKVANVAQLFDQVPILSASSPLKEKAGLGPFVLREYKPASHVLLSRNPRYWKKDSSGRQLPYLASLRLRIDSNRNTELVRFLRGEHHLINSLDAATLDRLKRKDGIEVKDLGPSLSSEMLWFNQNPDSPVPSYKREWFSSTEFRRAISSAINRQDLCRVVYKGHAQPGLGPVAPANQTWVNRDLKPHPFNPASALKTLEKAGFKFDRGVLRDAAGRPVRFSIITNAGNRARENMASMIQQDLRKIGIEMSITTLEFPSLVERIARTRDYEACLLGLVNVELDPMSQMNVWMSSSSHHQWRPNQKTPATGWEREIDQLMTKQAETADQKQRKQAFDRVQRIISEQAPFIYLVHPNTIVAARKEVRGLQPAILDPHTVWNIEHIRLAGEK